jgi:hypothetical protein
VKILSIIQERTDNYGVGGNILQLWGSCLQSLFQKQNKDGKKIKELAAK